MNKLAQMKLGCLFVMMVLITGSFFLTQTASAQDKETVVIGLNVPLSGSYQAQGKDQERAYKLAIQEINSQGGLLGKKIRYVLKDTQTNAEVARKNAVELIRKHGAIMLTGGSSSSVAIAQSDVCQENGVIFMAALTHSNATTGHMQTKAGHTVQKAHRHTFRWYFNAWMTGKALGPYLVKQYGEGKEYFYITADYTWGHTLEKSLRWTTELAGCDTLGSILTPLGQKSFSRELKNAQKAKPDILVLNLFGKDLVTALQQAKKLGLKNNMQIVAPLMELNIAHEAGIDAVAGVTSTTNWYWQLDYPGTKKFVNQFQKKYKKVPGEAAACAWVAIKEWASAVKRAGSFESAAIIKALEGHKFTLLKGPEQWRAWDHQAISSTYIIKGKIKSQSKGEWDFFNILEEFKGSEVMRDMSENPVMLEPL
jgi:ABC-type branched-subunit amino acid transport system substrate-binding protein